MPVSDVLGSLLPVFLFHRSATKNFYWDFLPDLQRAYFVGFFLSSLCRGGENSIEVTEEIVSNVLRGFYLPCHVMTLQGAVRVSYGYSI